jgi:protein TonB
MRRDLIIGLLVSLCIHVGAAWLGEMSRSKPKPKIKEDTSTIQLIEMPKLEPDEPDIKDDDQAPAPQDFAPPMQNDVPQIVTDTSFVQRLEPPPETTHIQKGQINIPQQSGFGKGIEVFDISKLDQVPVPTFQARPQYPFEMRRAGISGQVIVDFIVDANGTVRDAFAAQSTQREFESAAVQAVSKWRFKPGRKGGRVVNTHMQVPIVFTLDNQD